ncbi:MAG TPA: glutamine-synthetase adenylyltransferase, partial [Caulobacteraceae bacterium]
MDAPPLGALIRPCGPVVDAEAVSRLEEALGPVPAAPAPVFAASPYLAGLARRSPERLAATLDQPPAARLAEILASTEGLTGGADALRVPLRRLKADLHLLTAVADLGGVWDLGAVTGALSRFADAAVQAALRAAAHDAREKGRLIADPDAESGPVPGLFGLAMGKHGAFELNYSSDIDLSLFYDPARLGPALAAGVDPQTFVNRIAQALAGLLTERTADGYVFRVDLRLRPDPSSTPPVVAAPAALQYYESVGQNWERAAFIKARPVCGEAAAAAAFMAEMQRFVWRRSLDFAAVSDIQSIKRQIHVHKADERLEAAGCNLKLGRGGIREIEFFAQTQQLILGGRKPALRAPRTVDALKALAEAGHIDGGTATELCEAYVRLRGLEHRVQMLADEQTHILPEDPAARRAVAALAGQGDLAAFDADVSDLLRRVNARYGELFAEAESLSASHGSLVFTGVEDDPETLATLSRMGFSDPPAVAASIRAWH